MWEEEGKRYWQRAQRRRQCYAVVALCVLLAIAGGWYAWQVLLAGQTEQAAQAPAPVPKARLPSGKQLAACRARKTEPLFCQDRCAVVMHVPPKPFAYRACLAGCSQSAQHGLQQGCDINGLLDDSFDCETDMCSKACAEWQSKDPKGRTVRQCSDSCRNSHIAACKASIAYLQAAVAETNEL